MKLPDFLAQYFWDVDFFALDTSEDQNFIIERILEGGNEPAVQWLRTKYQQQELASVVRESRRLSPKSRHYWGLIYHLWSTWNPSVPPREGIWQR